MILDEVQYAPMLFRHITARVDQNRKPNGRYLLSGSQKFQLMEGVVESLAGRVSVIDLHSLSLSELAHWSKKKANYKQILEWCFLGGYPELHAGRLNPERFYSNLVVTYLERHIRGVLQVKSLLDFNRFLRLAATRSGQLVSAHGIAAELGLASNTVRSWISVLEACGLIALLPPYSNNPGKRLVKTPKLYFLDTGMLCFLLGIRSASDLAASSMAGAIFETLAFGQITRWFSNRLLRPSLYFYRDHAGREADFLIPVGDKVRLFDAKMATRPSPGSLDVVAAAIGEKNVIEKVIITPDSGDVRLPDWGVRLRSVIDPVPDDDVAKPVKRNSKRARGV